MKNDALANILNSFAPGIGDNKFTTTETAEEMIAKLPDSVWNSKTKFLDPACKSGTLLYEIYEKLMKTLENVSEFKDFETRREHILKNQLFGICPDEMSQMFSTRTIVGYLTDEYNIKSLDDYENKIMDKEEIKELFGGNIKFDVVIGYPQCDFRAVAEELADIICLYVD